jgi:hypothetical protein
MLLSELRVAAPDLDVDAILAAHPEVSSAFSGRPWVSCPRPGMKKLESAATTFPVEPRLPWHPSPHSAPPVKPEHDRHAIARSLR